MADYPDIVLASRTQDEATVRAILEGDGYAGIESTVMSDAPEPEAPPVDPAAAGGTEKTPEGETAPPDAAAPAGDPPAVVDPPAPVEPPKKKPSGYKAKFERGQTEIEELRRKLAEQEQRLAGTPAGDAPPKAAEPPAKTEPVKPAAAAPAVPDEKPKPNPEDFDAGVMDPAYVEAMADWKWDDRERKKAIAERERLEREAADRESTAKNEASAAEQAEYKATQDRFVASVEVAKAKYDDHDAMLEKNGDLPCPPVLQAEIFTDERGGELRYYLAAHPEEFTKIIEAMQGSKNPRRVAARELDRITTLLDADGVDDEVEDEPEAPPPVPAAPPKPVEPPKPAAREAKPKQEPIVPVVGRGSSGKKRLEDFTADELRAMPADDYRKLRGL